jgi:hypothetical protein
MHSIGLCVVALQKKPPEALDRDWLSLIDTREYICKGTACDRSGRIVEDDTTNEQGIRQLLIMMNQGHELVNAQLSIWVLSIQI